MSAIDTTVCILNLLHFVARTVETLLPSRLNCLYFAFGIVSRPADTCQLRGVKERRPHLSLHASICTIRRQVAVQVTQSSNAGSKVWTILSSVWSGSFLLQGKSFQCLSQLTDPKDPSLLTLGFMGPLQGCTRGSHAHSVKISHKNNGHGSCVLRPLSLPMCSVVPQDCTEKNHKFRDERAKIFKSNVTVSQ